MPTIKLTTCDNAIEANFIKNNLENEGIECFLTNEISSTLLPGFTGMLNAGVHIMINEEDFEKASALIKKPDSKKQITCPGCNSTNVSYSLGERKGLKILAVIFSLFAATPFGNIKRKYYCKDCRTEF
jgi:hypothetical protein